jgi:hypothetical protein
MFNEFEESPCMTAPEDKARTLCLYMTIFGPLDKWDYFLALIIAPSNVIFDIDRKYLLHLLMLQLLLQFHYNWLI